jgi:hypothetical protein
MVCAIYPLLFLPSLSLLCSSILPRPSQKILTRSCRKRGKSAVRLALDLHRLFLQTEERQGASEEEGRSGQEDEEQIETRREKGGRGRWGDGARRRDNSGAEAVRKLSQRRRGFKSSWARSPSS